MDDAGPGPYLPIWQIYPPTTANKNSVMYNQMSDAVRARAISTMLETERPAITEVLSHNSKESRGTLYYPVFDGFYDDPRVVGAMSELNVVKWLMSMPLCSSLWRPSLE
jgi:CHASE1-domain containing sensor protein